MYELLELYARLYRKEELVICVGEKSRHLLRQTRTPITVRLGAPIKEDYEYRRAGMRSICLVVEPKGGRRRPKVPARCTKPDFVRFIGQLGEKVYTGAQKIIW